MNEILKLLLKTIGISTLALVHISLCIFLYLNFGIIPFVIYLFISTLIYFIIEGNSDFVRSFFARGTWNYRDPIVFLHNSGKNFTNKTQFWFRFCCLFVYTCLGISFYFIENKYLAVSLFVIFSFTIITILSRIFDRFN